ncbi:MAG: glutaredoxin [Maribacter sp.]|jgi:glutaredoxin
MKHFPLILLISVFCLLNITAQSLHLTEKKSGNEISIICNNPSSKDFELTFTYGISGFNADRSSPVVQVVKAGGKSKIVTFTGIPGVSGTYKMSYSYTEISKGTLPASSAASTNMNGIHVFSKSGCSRCSYVLSDLEKNNVAFKDHNTDNSDVDNRLMWKMLYRAGFKGNSISMPVVVVDNKVYYNIPNLKNLLAWLKR